MAPLHSLPAQETNVIGVPINLPPLLQVSTCISNYAVEVKSHPNE